MELLVTNDLEHLDISSGAMRKDVGREIVDEALPKLLKLYSKYNVKSTFFVLGSFARLFPEAVELISKAGHEIGSHGFSHEVQHGFDVMTYNEQYRHLKYSKHLLEKLSNQEVISFRSPALRINSDTVRALEDSGYLIDSSVCPRRLDSFFSYGTSSKLGWLDCPKETYQMSEESPFKRGNSKILEIPVSASVFGFVGSTMRVSPFIFKFIRNSVARNSIKYRTPCVFLFHPNELIKHQNRAIKQRSDNFFSFLFKDFLRTRLKSRNLGEKSFRLLESMLYKFKKADFEFMTLKSYYEHGN